MPGRSAADRLHVAERQTRAMELSLMGWSYREIVEHGNIGYNPEAKNASATVAMDIKRALENRRKKRDEQTLLIIERELVKLDLMERAAWQVLSARHYVVNQGVVVWHDPDAEPEARKRRGWANIVELTEDLQRQADIEAGKPGHQRRPLDDDAPVLAACMTLLKIAERRAKLLGLDAPVKKILEVESGDGVDERIAGLLAKLAAGGQGQIAAAPTAGGLPE